jgi:Rnk-like GreA/GreB family RNA polymerase interacting protein
MVPSEVASVCLDRSAIMSLPSISITATDRPRLEKLALLSAQRGDKYAPFLLAEIRRARVVSDDACDVKSLVTVGPQSRTGRTEVFAGG